MNDSVRFPDQLIARMAESMDDATFARMFSPDGLARTCDWVCEDDWIVSYTTTRVRHGRFDGEFCVFVYQPKGRRGEQRRWERVEVRRCKTRREARALAEDRYYAHSPKRAAKHGRTVA